MAVIFNVTTCLFTCSKAALTGVGITVNDTNCEFSWAPPAFPAYNAVKTDFAKDTLLAGAATPPRGGTPPFNYAYGFDPFGNNRDDIGAVYCQSPTTPCLVHFEDNSAGGVPPYTVEWEDFGDESEPESGADIYHQYAAEGDYEVTEKVTDAALTVSRKTKTVHAFNNPQE